MMTSNIKIHYFLTVPTMVLLSLLPFALFLLDKNPFVSESAELIHLAVALLAAPPLLLLSLLRYQIPQQRTFASRLVSSRVMAILTLINQFFLVAFLCVKNSSSGVYEFSSPILFSIYVALMGPFHKQTVRHCQTKSLAVLAILTLIFTLLFSWELIPPHISQRIGASGSFAISLALIIKSIWLKTYRENACILIAHSWVGLTSLMLLTTTLSLIPMATSVAFLFLVYLVTISLLISNAQVIKPEGLINILYGRNLHQEITKMQNELKLQERRSLEFEKQLEDSNLLAAATLDNMSAQVCIIDAEGRVSATNKSWRSFVASLQSQPATLLGQGSIFSSHDFIDEKVRFSIDKISAALKSLKIDTSRDHMEIIDYQCGNQLKYFQVKLSVFSSDFGDRYLITQEDVTELKETEEELRLKTIALERANDGIVITDPNSKDNPIIYVSQGFLRLTGYSQQEVLGLNCRFMQGPKTNRAVVEKMRLAIERGEPFTGELINYKKDGTIWFNRLKLEPIRNSRGELIRYVGVQMDITASKLLEAERKQALERATKAKQELERLYQEAQNANSIKDDFLATLSHELRTPAGVIVGFTELLKYEELNSSEKEEALDALERNSRALVTLIDDLLDMNRVITGKFKLSPKPVDVTSVVDSVISAELLAAQTKNIRIVTDFDPGAGPVYGDITRLQQIFWNLLSNAIKFTPRNGRVKVAIRTEGTRLVVRVTDTGIGIDPRFLPYVFERFRQQTEGMSRSYGGLGLGLSIVKHLVELHGGQVYAESVGPGKGATFTVSLPALTTTG